VATTANDSLTRNFYDNDGHLVAVLIQVDTYRYIYDDAGELVHQIRYTR